MRNLKRNVALIGSTAVIAAAGLGGIMTAQADNSTNPTQSSDQSQSSDKDEKGERTGAVLEVGNSAQFLGILLAHEVGHYLGLAHAGNITNVMGDDSDGDGIGSINGTSVNLTTSQGNTMKSHCSIRPSC